MLENILSSIDFLGTKIKKSGLTLGVGIMLAALSCGSGEPPCGLRTNCDNPDETSHSDTTTFDGINVKAAKTNSSGEAYFTDDQTGEEVTIFVRDELRNPVFDADVIFWDGDGFESYQTIHSDFSPSLKIFSHNSIHEIILKTASFVCDTYNNTTNNNSNRAAKEFSNSLYSGGSSEGCVLRNDLHSALNEKINTVIDLSDYAGSVSNLVKPVLVCSKVLLIDIPYSAVDEYLTGNDVCPAYSTWTANPANQIARRGNISSILGVSGCLDDIPEEIRGNGIDDDCDGVIDEYSGSDGNTGDDDICHDNLEYSCLNDSVVIIESCGVVVDSIDCDSDEVCDVGSCVPNDSDCTSHFYYTCVGDDSYWQDSCGNIEGLHEDCTTEEHCEDYFGCEPGGPACTPFSYIDCTGSNSYWNDSCGNTTEHIETCDSNEDCVDGEGCVTSTSDTRITNLSDGSFRDNLREKTWYSAASSGVSWDTANSRCNDLTLGGSSSWSLPTRSQLSDLINPYPSEWGTISSQKWTSTPCSTGHITLRISDSLETCYTDATNLTAWCIKN